MSGRSSSSVGWYSRLAPADSSPGDIRRPDDPRLEEVIESWKGDPEALRPGRGVLVGFPQDEGIRRNRGRVGAAGAPREIRHYLHRLVPIDAETGTDLTVFPPLDAGNVTIDGSLEESQEALAQVVAGILAAGAVPIVLGGGHETAWGHYLGHVRAGITPAVINIDAHLDVRPCLPEGGHSGSPFRQAMEHPGHPLTRYVCLGAQGANVSIQHRDYVRKAGGAMAWAGEVRGSLVRVFERERERLRGEDCHIYVTLDADVAREADVPGVSAPNPAGLDGREIAACIRVAGRFPEVAGFDLVEINPLFDRDGRSSRWGAWVVWNFLMGLGERENQAI